MTAATHFEPYLLLAGLTSDSVLIAWGGFWFREDTGGRLRLVDDDDVEGVDAGRTDTIGARSVPYGEAVVEVVDGDGAVVARGTASEENHVWLHGLRPATEYRYRVEVDGEEWAAGPRRDWRNGPGGGALGPPDHRYDNVFRTHPDPDDERPLTFLVVGDFGYGVRGDDPESARQRAVARAMHVAAERHDARLVLTVGDNIYLGEDETDGGDETTADGTGAEDDDWFFTFYQPYRYLLNRLPWYPVVGNHDADETERSDDRDQVSDNFFTDLRFTADVEPKRTSIEPGLFYSFDVGRLVDFVAVDTTEASDLDEKRYFGHPDHRRFLEDEFPDRDRAAPERPRWHIPFSHHPPYCAGPSHHNDQAQLADLVPLYRRAGVRCVLAGHEHNFQWSEHDGMHVFVTGAGAKLRSGRPDAMGEAFTRGWSAEGHFLLCRLDRDRLEVTPWAGLSDDGELRPIDVVGPDGDPVPLPIVVER